MASPTVTTTPELRLAQRQAEASMNRRAQYLMAAWTAIFLMAAFLWPAYMGLWGALWTTAVCLTDLACRVLRKKVHP